MAELCITGLALTVLTQTNIIHSFSNLTPGTEWSFYESFNGAWYYEISVILQETMIINCFWTNLFDLLFYLKVAYSRLSDRKFASNIKGAPDDDFDDTINTEKSM